ncbi:hypothetical protein BMETH_667_0 [methanotrophic bacterial endosymbiont of Bathymodiolus sp.]|nr:hypothetical protein BMETH_667_0 [methanotrophic bacterial endosymbiont of Bathymodiolus sp.]
MFIISLAEKLAENAFWVGHLKLLQIKRQLLLYFSYVRALQKVIYNKNY